MRAAKAAGREVFGYNRSIDGVEAARFDGFDATDDLDDALARAADDRRADRARGTRARAADRCSDTSAPARRSCALTDVTSVKGAVLQDGPGPRPRSTASSAGIRWPAPHIRVGQAGDARLFVGAPWVISVDDHVDPDVWAKVHAPGAGLRRGRRPRPLRRARRRGRGHLAPAAPARRGTRGHRRRRPAGVRAGRRLVPRRHAGGGDRARPGPGDVRGELRRSCTALWTARSTCSPRPATTLPRERPVAELVEAGHAARMRYDSFSRPEILTVTIGAEDWRDELAAAGRAGGVIRSALPVLDSRG